MQRGWLPPLDRKKESGNDLCPYLNRPTPNPTARMFPLQKCTESPFLSATLPQYVLAGAPSVNGINALNAAGVNLGGRPESAASAAWDAAATAALLTGTFLGG